MDEKWLYNMTHWIAPEKGGGYIKFWRIMDVQWNIVCNAKQFY